MWRWQIGVAVVILLGAAASFIAANGTGNELQVEQSESGNISVEFKDADIRDVFRVLALKGNISIVADPDVQGMVTVQITDVPWEKVLDVICRTYGYSYEREGNIIRVTTLEKQGQENLETEVFTLNYANAKDVAESVMEMRSERGKIKFDDRANLIIVTDVPTNIYKIEKVIRRLDEITPQVTIEAKIIETVLNNGDDIGLKWNAQYSANMASRPVTFPWKNSWSLNPTGTNSYMGRTKITDALGEEVSVVGFPDPSTDAFSFGILDGSAFSVLLQALSSRGKTKVLSNPRITTMDNQPAEIHVGTDWPIAEYTYSEQSDRFVISGYNYKSFGVLLNVTPTINKDGYVTLKIHPEISDRIDDVDFQGAAVPILSTQTADATVMIKDGETVVIGGLLKDKKVSTTTKIPLLGDLPFIGKVFSHTSDTVNQNDLLIFITPRIVGSQNISKRQKLVRKLSSAPASPLSDVESTPVLSDEAGTPTMEETANLPESTLEDSLIDPLMMDEPLLEESAPQEIPALPESLQEPGTQEAPESTAPEMQQMPSQGKDSQRKNNKWK